MVITEVKVYPFEVGNVRAYADVTIDDALVLRGIKVLQAPNGGLYLGYPSQRGREGRYQDLIVPRSNKVAEAIRRAVIDKYKEVQAGEPQL